MHHKFSIPCTKLITVLRYRAKDYHVYVPQMVTLAKIHHIGPFQMRSYVAQKDMYLVLFGICST